MVKSAGPSAWDSNGTGACTASAPARCWCSLALEYLLGTRAKVKVRVISSLNVRQIYKVQREVKGCMCEVACTVHCDVTG